MKAKKGSYAPFIKYAYIYKQTYIQGTNCHYLLTVMRLTASALADGISAERLTPAN